jgi:hypothetical protein
LFHVVPPREKSGGFYNQGDMGGLFRSGQYDWIGETQFTKNPKKSITLTAKKY